MRTPLMVFVAVCSIGGFAQYWEPISRPCGQVEMTSDGFGFCSEGEFISPSSGSIYKLYFTDDEWETNALIGQGGLSGLYCGADLLTRAAPRGVAFIVDCGPDFLMTENLDPGSVPNWNGMNGSFWDEAHSLAPVADSLCFIAAGSFNGSGFQLSISRQRMAVGSNAALDHVNIIDTTGMWGPMMMDFRSDLNGVFVVTKIGVASEIWTTNDGAITWQLRRQVPSSILRAAKYFDDGTIWVVGDTAMVQRSTDAGNTWEQFQLPINDDIWSVDGYSPDSVWLAGEDGRVIATSDAGATWSFKPRLERTVRKIQTLDGAVYAYTADAFLSYGGLYRFYPQIHDQVQLGIGSWWSANADGFELRLRDGEVLAGLDIFDCAGRRVPSMTAGSMVMMVGNANDMYIMRLRTSQRTEVGRMIWLEEN